MKNLRISHRLAISSRSQFYYIEISNWFLITRLITGNIIYYDNDGSKVIDIKRL